MSKAAEVVEEVVESTDVVESSDTPAYPDTWREMYAGEDEAKLSKLANYASPNAAFDAMISAHPKKSLLKLRS